MLALLLLLARMSGQVSAAANDSDKESGMDAASGLVKNMFGGDVDIETVKQLVHTETKESIRGIIRSPLGLSSARIYGVISDRISTAGSAAVKFVERCFSANLLQAPADPETRDKLQHIKDEALHTLRTLETAEFSDNIIMLQFEDNRGQYRAMYFSLRLREKGYRYQDPDKPYWDVAFGLITADFEPAPDYMVITESSKSFFSSSSREVLVPIHRGLTQDAMTTMMKIAAPRMVALIASSKSSNIECHGDECGRHHEFQRF